MNAWVQPWLGEFDRARRGDLRQLGLAHGEEFLVGLALRAGDIDMLDLPRARGDGEPAFDGAAILELGDKRRGRAGIAVERGEEAALAVEHQGTIVELRRDRARGRLAANPAALRQFTCVREGALLGNARRLGVLRRRRGRSRAASEREQPDRRRARHPHAPSVSRRVAISALA